MPDLTGTMHQIIEATLGQSKLRDITTSQVGNYKGYMERYNHCNFRTFQVFLSKAKFLYKHCSNIKINTDKKDELLSDIVFQCFAATLVNCAKLKKRVESGKYDMQYPLPVHYPFVELFVEKGIYNLDNTKTDMKNYADAAFGGLPGDDPVKILKSEYFIHDEGWVNEQYKELLKNLKNGKYDVSDYSTILPVVNNLVDAGFDQKLYADTVDAMRDGISKSSKPVRLIKIPGFYSSDKKYEPVINSSEELNRLINNKTSSIKKSSWENILESDTWTEELEKYIVDELRRGDNKPLLMRVDIDKWVKRIRKSTAKQIDNFRVILSEYYPFHITSDALEADLPEVKELAEKLNVVLEEDKKMDKILKLNIGWLRDDLMERYNSVR